MIRGSKKIFTTIKYSLISLVVILVLIAGNTARLLQSRLREYRIELALRSNHERDPVLEKMIDEIYSDRSHMLQNVPQRGVQHKIPTHYENPGSGKIQVFDPRFTLGIYIYHVGQKEGDLPFNWYDWVDLTMLNKMIVSPPERSGSCHDFVSSIAFPGDGDTFCSDNVKSSDLGYTIKSQAPYRLSEEMTKRVSKSYLYTTAPIPDQVIFSTKSGALHSFTTNGTKKLLDSTLVRDYISKSTRKVVDVHQEYDILTKNERNYIKELESDVKIPFTSFDFDYESTVKALKQRENELTPRERRYLESIQYSKEKVEAKQVTKYFQEVELVQQMNGGYDWRFFNGVINVKQRELVIIRLLRAWLQFTRNAEITTWIAHGTLLSWHFNGLNFPYDTDIDVQMPLSDLHKLSLHYNQSVVVEDIHEGYGRYFIDCGTWITLREHENVLNNIDARFIDIDTGVYIDITGLAISNEWPSGPFVPAKYLDQENVLSKNAKSLNKKLQLVSCRNRHTLRYKSLTPLRKTTIAGEIGYVPGNINEQLDMEYGNNAVLMNSFQEYYYITKLRLWIRKYDLQEFLKDPSAWRITNRERINNRKPGTTAFLKELEEEYSKKSNRELTNNEIGIIENLSNDQILNLLANNDILGDFVSTRDLTAFHVEELKDIYHGRSTSKALTNLQPFKASKPDLFTYKVQVEKFDFNWANQRLQQLIEEVHPREELPK